MIRRVPLAMPLILAAILGLILYFSRKWDPFATMPPENVAYWVSIVYIAGYFYLAFSGLGYITGRVGSAGQFTLDQLASLVPAGVLAYAWISHGIGISRGDDTLTMSFTIGTIVTAASAAVLADLIIVGGMGALFNRLQPEWGRQN